MSEHINHHRRRFLGTAATTIAAASLGAIRPARAQSSKTRQADVSPSKPGSHTSFGPTKQIDAGLLNIGYAEVGPTDGSVVILCTGGPTTSTAMSMSLLCWHRRATGPSSRICAATGTTRFLASETFRNGQQSAVALDI